MSLGARLILTHVLVGVVSLMLIAAIAWLVASEALRTVSEEATSALETAAYDELKSMREIKGKQVRQYFAERQSDMDALVDTVATLRQDGFQKFEVIHKSKVARLTDYLDSLKGQLHVLKDDPYSWQALIELDRAFEESGDDVASEAWTAAAAKYDGRMKDIVADNGWYDLLLIHTDGDIVYTCARESDLGVTIPDSALKDSPIGKAFAKAQGIGTREVVFGDFGPYAPSKGAQAAFMMGKMVNESGGLVGYAALQVPSDNINRIVQERKGMGETGESYLVGRVDGQTAYRSDRVVKSGKIGEPKSGSGIDLAFAGQSGARTKTGSNGDMELEGYGPLAIEGADWCLISTQRLEEILAPVLEGQRYDYFAKYAAKHGYHDLFLLNPNGYCFYSVAHEADYQTNLLRGAYADSSLGEAVRKCLDAKELAFGDFAPYEASGGAPAAFIAQPVMNKGEVELAVAVQISGTSINKMMQAGSNREKTREAYLVGPEGRMRSDSVVNPEYSVAACFEENKTVASEAVSEALGGTTGEKIIAKHMDAGNSILSAFAPLDVFGTRWALICEVDEAVAMAAKTEMAGASASASKQLVLWIAGSLIAVALVVTMLASFIARSIGRPIERVSSVADAIAAGDVDQRLNMERYDEVGRLANALDGMADALSKSLWLTSGSSELAAQMRGERDIAVLAQDVVGYLAKYLGAQMASLYLADDAGESLILVGSYAFGKGTRLDARIELGEGLAGQAALEKRVISVTEVPEDYARINSTLGDSAPCNILAAPFVHEGSLMGVLEFASFREFSDTKMAFLGSATESVAIAFNSARVRQKTQELLEETQRQSEELAAQAEVLQSQQEELKGTNEELEQQSEELQASNEELEEKTNALERQKAKIEERTREVEEAKGNAEAKARELELASKYKSEFLANMSHELRTPLNSLLILSKVLAENREGNLSAGEAESAEVIYGGGQDLLFLINEILDLSKVEAGMMEVHQEEVRLEDVAEHLRRQFAPGAEEKGLDFEITVAADLPPAIVTDSQRLEQILRNFLSNAFKFTAEGSVRLSIGRPAEAVRFSCERLTSTNTLAFSVCDTGPGIPAEKQEAIFGAFQQADGSTKRQYGGTGLGLSISRALAHLLNGEVQLESVAGSGSTFFLYLPLERRAASAEEGVAPSAKEAGPKRRAVRPERPVAAAAPEFLPDDRKALKEGDRSVLIIEDDAAFAKILMGQARERGFKCLAAGDGGSGLQLAAEYTPSAIILDLGLPDIDGATVLDGLKYDLATRHIPVHVMSARDKTSDIMGKGAVGYVTKPVDAEGINAALGTIEEILDGAVRNVLVVEDDANSRKAIETLLSGEAVAITGVGSGEEANNLIRGGHFDCVILDLGLPDMSGFELLARLDADSSVVMPPTIVYTGKELTAEEVRELGQYTANVVVKGVNSPERLLDETSLFLHTLESSLPQAQKQMLRMLHSPEHVLEGRKVLLVDDDLRNSFALSKALKGAGLVVVLAENGKTALETLDAEAGIELVLMDIMMPVMDGYETMSRIRKEARFKDLPIVALTAKAMVEDRAKCIEAGANDYLAKPIDVERLMSLMRVLLYR